MQKVVVTVEHQLSPTEVRHRVEKLLLRVHDLGGVWNGRWVSDACLHFTGKVQGQTVTGEVQIEDRAVKAVINLPLTLALFSSRIKSMMEQSARQALADRPANHERTCQ